MSTDLDLNSATHQKLGRAAQLINRVCDSGDCDIDALARVLNVPVLKLTAFASGDEPMPLNYQARLALFVIGQLPRFIREGNRLRHQVAAAIAYESHATERHSYPP